MHKSFTKMSRHWRWLASASALLAALCAWVAFGPFPDELLARDNFTSTRIVDRHGQPLREALGSQEGRARWTELDDISPHMLAATVHAEDRRFWSHGGVDMRAVGRAAWQNLTHLDVVSGASTLTQQVVKMLGGGSRARTVPNKLTEAVWAVRLERKHSKRRILEEYLNRAPYGNQLFGVSAAARMYFDKPPSQLTLAEATLLAGIPRAPSVNNPYADRERSEDVQRRVLDLMLEREAIDQEAYERALSERLRIVSRRGRVLAAHFTDHVLDELGDELRPQRVQTTLDLGVQQLASEVVDTELDRLEDHDVGQAAVVVLDTQTSEVLAWVGSRGYFEQESEGANDGVLSLRQPGSALKPFVYGLYIDDGGEASDVLPDFPTQFEDDDGVYIPRNFGGRYHGPVSVREALASSLNIPAVVVAERLGVGRVQKTLRALGMQSLDAEASHYGLGIALGNGEVRLLDLAGAYATLGRLGQHRRVRIFGDASNPVADTRLLSAQAAHIILDILTDDDARARGFGRYSALHLPYRVAAKTGTSTDFRDNWAVGMTPEFTVAVWAGNFDGSPMQGTSGVTGAAPIMRHIMQGLYPDAANPADVDWFEQPRGIAERPVCTLSGQPPGEACPSTRLELTVARDGTPTHDDICTVHRTVPIDIRNGLRAGPDCADRFVEQHHFLDVPDAWTEWALKRGHPLMPADYSPHCPADGAPSADAAEPSTPRITHPVDGDRYVLDPSLPASEQAIALRARLRAAAPDETLTWFVDGEPIAEVRAPFEVFWELEPGRHQIGVGREAVEARVEISVRP
jgi:penicillin-binding protein 1C